MKTQEICDFLFIACEKGIYYMSHDVRKPTFLFPTRSDTNRAVQRKKMDRALKFRIKKEEGFYYMYPCTENKGYCEADLRLCFRICKMLVFS